MSSGETMEPLREQIVAAVARLGIRAREIVAISAPDAAKRGRSTWRVELASGATVKARLLESAAEARRLLGVREGLEYAFAPAIGCDGRVLIEEWVQGRSLTAPEADARAEECGALLGRLHLRGREQPVDELAAEWRLRAQDDLRALGAAAVLDALEIDRLAEVLAVGAPRHADRTIAHEDFCPSNMILDARGRLRVIDNEWFGARPAGLDVGRTFVRWSMADGAWSRFLRGYRASGSSEPEGLPFWQIAAALWTTRLRLAQPDRVGEPLALLRRLLADAEARRRSGSTA